MIEWSWEEARKKKKGALMNFFVGCKTFVPFSLLSFSFLFILDINNTKTRRKRRKIKNYFDVFLSFFLFISPNKWDTVFTNNQTSKRKVTTRLSVHIIKSLFTNNTLDITPIVVTVLEVAVLKPLEKQIQLLLLVIVVPWWLRMS